MSYIDKIARTQSSDPEQEKLRAAKDAWNEEVSLLISELIAFKRAINGRGDKNFGIPPSSIKDPLPPQVSNLMSMITNQADKVVNEAGRIDQFQSYYSSHRKKSKNAALEPNLVAEGSWWGSRLWAYFALMKKVNRTERKLRLKMISSCQELQNDLRVFEKLITDYKNPNSIPLSVNRLGEILYSLIGDLFFTFQKLTILDKEKNSIVTNPSPEVSQPAEQPSPAPIVESMPVSNSPEDSEYADFKAMLDQQVAIEMVVMHLLNLDSVSESDKKKLEDNRSEFQTKLTTYNNLMNRKDAENIVNSDKLLKSIKKHYNILEKLVFKYLNNSNFNELAVTLQNKVVTAARALEYLEGLNKQAVSSVEHWINKKLLTVNPSNLDKIRIDVADLASMLSNKIEKFSDLLEQGKELNALIEHFASTKKDIVALIDRLQALAHLHEMKIRRLNLEANGNFPVTDAKDLRKLDKIKNQLVAA